MAQMKEGKMTDGSYLFASLASGAVAGFSVDVSLYPLDTLKTRLQAKDGFWKSGGLKNIYAGLGPAAVGSAPNAAAFFVTYEAVKLAATRLQYANGLNISKNDSRVHMLAASVGEVNACLIRVPVEIVKQRRQALSSTYSSSMDVIRKTWHIEGLKGFYRGYFTTVMREIPFSLLQFPIWEKLKIMWKTKQMKEVEPWQSAICGSAAGGFSAAVTTPLDVAKTRIMLASVGSEMASKQSIRFAVKTLLQESGVKGLFAGVVPRTLWISIGGAVFFGVYEKMKTITTSYIDVG